MDDFLTKRRKIQFGLMLFSAVMIISFSFYFYQVFFSPNILVGRQEAEITIPSGTNFNELIAILDHQRILKDPVSFGFVSKLMKYQKNIRSGHYLLQPNMTNIEVIRMLRGGMQKPVSVVLNNVRIPADIAERASENLEMDQDSFLETYADPNTAEQFGFDSANFLAMFLPNTYEVYWNISPAHFFKRMNEEYKKFWTTERKDKAKEIGLSPVEVSVLASIVQAETNLSEEKPIIAGVYINRLNRGMKLQADPTVVYAIGDFSINRVLTVHKQVDSPYNTYMYAGLPPGPINLPEIGTLDAVLNYQQSDYIYFCAKEDFSGKHNFATNLRDHNNNARRYQNALNQRRIYR